MKVFAWLFFGFYSFGLVLSALPVMRFGFLAGLAAILYVAWAQFWVVYSNRHKFSGFFKSSFFHFLPILLVTYVTGSQLIYFYTQGDTDNFASGMFLSLLVLLVPYVIIWVQYLLLRKAYGPLGIFREAD